MMANGSWPDASSRRVWLVSASRLRTSAAKRRFPARRRSRASPAEIIGASSFPELCECGDLSIRTTPTALHRPRWRGTIRLTDGHAAPPLVDAAVVHGRRRVDGGQRGVRNDLHLPLP